MAGKPEILPKKEVTPKPFHKPRRQTVQRTQYQQNTARATSETVLRQGEEKFHGLFTTMREAVVLFELIRSSKGKTVDCRVLDANPAVEKMTGITPAEAIGRTMRELFPDTDDFWFDTYGKVETTGEPVCFERRFDPLGRFYHTSVYRPAPGQIAIVFTDITEHKKAEELLEWDARRDKLLSATAARLLESEDPQGLVEDLCRQVCDFLDCQAFFNFLVDEGAGRLHLNACAGIPEEQVRQIEWLDYGVAVCGCVARDRKRIIAEDIQNTTDLRMDMVKSYGIQAYCCYPLLVQGRLVGTLSFGTRKRPQFRPEDIELMEAVTRLVAMAMSRVETERALRENELRLKRSQEIAHLGSWELDVVNDRLTWSDEVYRIFGLRPQEFDATYEAFLERVHPDDRAAVDAAYSGSIREGRDTYEIEHRVLRRSSGEIRYVHEKCEHFRDAAGKIIRSVGMVHDITERKHAAEQIEAMARFPSENPFPVLRIASDGTILYSNVPGLSLLEKWRRGVGEKAPPDWCKRVAHAVDSGRNIVRQVKCGQRVLSVVAAPVIKGRYVNLYGRDITKERKVDLALRKARAELEKKVRQRTDELAQMVGILQEEALQRMHAEEAVRAERQRFSDVLETLPAYICLLTPDYYMPFANRVFREWFGYYPDKKCYEFLFNRTEPCETCETYTVLKTMKPHRWEWTGPNGRNYDIFDFPFTDTDGSRLILEMGTDITELKQAEKALRNSEERYRSLVVATTQIVWTTGAQGQVESDLPSWRAFTGQGEQEIQGWGWIEALHPDDRERTAEIWSRAVRDCVLYQTEYRLKRHDGQYRHVAVRGVPVIEPDGRIREWIGTCTDITEKKTAEEELDNYRMRLEELVKQRTQELARSNRDLEQFAYVASHDLQEPLRAVAGFVELLRRNLQSSLNAKTTKYMDFTVDGAMRMQSLISGLLEYSRIGTRGKEPQRTDAGAALERAIANLQTSIRESGAEITAGTLPMIYFDDVQLCQLFQNLIGNAIKFRADQVPRIHISAVRLDDSWQFAVEDNGIGIDPQYAERIFLIFQRLHNREQYPGTGIGLSICKKIVERHNGKIWVESTPGNGSTFYFTIPDKGDPTG